MSKRESKVPYPLASDLPEFLSTLGVGTPAIWVDFDIFICKHCLKCSTSMIEIQHILHQEAIDRKGRNEEFVDPPIDALSYRDRLLRRRSLMSSNNHARLRQVLP